MIKEQMKYVTDMAFEAVDADGSESLDREEIFDIMKEVAIEMNVTAPGDDDIVSVLQQLDQDQDGNVGKDEFALLMGLVLGKMLESEIYYQDSLEGADPEKQKLEKLKLVIGARLANAFIDKNYKIKHD